MENSLEEEILKLYREPGIGASYQNTYGEMNISNLIGKYRQLCSEGIGSDSATENAST